MSFSQRLARMHEAERIRNTGLSYFYFYTPFFSQSDYYIAAGQAQITWLDTFLSGLDLLWAVNKCAMTLLMIYY